MLLRLTLCFVMVLGGFLIAAESSDAAVFGRCGRASRNYYSRPSRPTQSYRNTRGYAVRGPSPLTIRVSPARYRYLKTFYPNQVRTVR